jgi:transcription initiation factor TFIID TATA-box-binding protein
MATITNIVATAYLNCPLDLQKINDTLPLSQYLPKRFSGLLLRTFQPYKAHCQLYKNGKMTVNGAKSVRAAKALARRFSRKLCRVGFPCSVSDFKVVNVVATCNFGKRLDLDVLAKVFNAHFSPELFPGLRVKLSECSAVLFHTGKCNLLGGKSALDVYSGFIELYIQIN